MAFGDVQEAVVDLTMVFDPAAVWPDPQACPDWSMRGAGERVLCSQADAEDRLLVLHQSLGRGMPTRLPSPEDLTSVRETYFKECTGVGPWSLTLGFPGYTWRDHVRESEARLIVEALHLRGYLRKVEVREARQAESREAAERRHLEEAVAGYAQRAEGLQARLNGAKAGEARHLQRVADEADAAEAADVRRSLQALHTGAVTGATALGVDPPPTPDL